MTQEKEEEERGVFARLMYDTIFKIVFAKEENRGSLLFLLNICLFHKKDSFLSQPSG